MLAHNFFNEKDEQLIVEAIKDAESRTSSEIRVHIENFCWGDALKSARRIFQKLKLHETRERNGVLIYIAVFSKKIAVIGDQGIHQKLGKDYWNKTVSNLTAEFRVSRQAAALARCIRDCGDQLSKYFPATSENRNEISDSISH